MSVTAVSVQVGSTWTRTDPDGVHSVMFVVRSITATGRVAGLTVEGRKHVQTTRAAMLTDGRFRFVAEPTERSLEHLKPTRNKNGHRPDPSRERKHVDTMRPRQLAHAQRVGRRLQRLREEAGIPRQAMAREIGIDTSVLEHVESGTTVCTLWLAEQIAEVLDVSLDELSPVEVEAAE